MYFCFVYAVVCCSCCSVDRFSNSTVWFSHHSENTVRPQWIRLRGMETVTPDVASSLSLSSCKTYTTNITFVVPRLKMNPLKCFYILFNQQQGQLTSDVLLTSNSVSVIFPEKIPSEVVFSHFNNIFFLSLTLSDFCKNWKRMERFISLIVIRWPIRGGDSPS